MLVNQPAHKLMEVVHQAMVSKDANARSSSRHFISKLRK